MPNHQTENREGGGRSGWETREKVRLGFERKGEGQYYRDGAVNSREEEGRRDMVYGRQRWEMGEGRE